MNLRIKHYFCYFLSLLLFILILGVMFCSSPKIVFLQTNTEKNIIHYSYKKFGNGIVLPTTDVDTALKLSKLNNTKLFLTQAASTLYEIEAPYYTFSKDKKDNAFHLDFNSFISTFENVAILDNSLDSLELPNLPTVQYDKKISKYEVESIVNKLKKEKVKNVIIINLSECEEILKSEEFTFFIPKGGEYIHQGSNIFTYSPDFDSIFNSLQSGDELGSGYKILPSWK